jgi:hypothetical protein
MNNGELQCLLDERSDCVHVGFVYSLPELYGIISSKGIQGSSLSIHLIMGLLKDIIKNQFFRLNSKDTKLCRIRIRRGQRRRTSNIFYFGVFIQ